MEVFSVMEVTVDDPASNTECLVETTKLASLFRSRLRPRYSPDFFFVLPMSASRLKIRLVCYSMRKIASQSMGESSATTTTATATAAATMASMASLAEETNL